MCVCLLDVCHHECMVVRASIRDAVSVELCVQGRQEMNTCVMLLSDSYLYVICVMLYATECCCIVLASLRETL